MPPSSCTQSVVTRIAVSDANSFAIDDALPGSGKTGVEQRARAVHEQRRRFHLRRHVGEHELQSLEIGEPRAELLAILHVARRELERTPCDTERLRAHERPRTVERAHRVLESAALVADQVLGRHRALVERDLAGGRTPHAELALELRDAEAGKRLLHHETADAAVTGIGIGLREHGVEVAHARRW